MQIITSTHHPQLIITTWYNSKNFFKRYFTMPHPKCIFLHHHEIHTWDERSFSRRSWENHVWWVCGILEGSLTGNHRTTLNRYQQRKQKNEEFPTDTFAWEQNKTKRCKEKSLSGWSWILGGHVTLEMRIIKIIFVIRYHKGRSRKRRTWKWQEWINNINLITWITSRYVSKLTDCLKIPRVDFWCGLPTVSTSASGTRFLSLHGCIQHLEFWLALRLKMVERQDVEMGNLSKQEWQIRV